MKQDAFLKPKLLITFIKVLVLGQAYFRLNGHGSHLGLVTWIIYIFFQPTYVCFTLNLALIDQAILEPLDIIVTYVHTNL